MPASPPSLGRFVKSIGALYLFAFALVLLRDVVLLPADSPFAAGTVTAPAAGSDEVEHGAGAGDEPLPPPVAPDSSSSLGSWLGPESPTIVSGERNAWKDSNQRQLRALHACLAARSCSEHQTKVVILQDDDYRKAYLDQPGGEKIWSRSVIRALDQLGVTYLYAAEYQLVSAYYSMLPGLVKAAIMKCEAIEECWEDREGDCLRTRENPHGLPITQLFCPEFFGHSRGSPLGAQWSLSPEPIHWQPTTYIGYSIEDECTQDAVVPSEQRLRRVWVLAKHYRYFTSERFPYSPDIFVRASAELNIEFVGAYDFDGAPAGAPFPGVTNLAAGDGSVLAKAEFEREVRNSLAIVGLFDPVISPTPYYGLCWGLPFINPGEYEYDADGKLESVRESQHEFAAREGEPHVYNVPRHNDTAFLAALRHATSTPHASYIPERMRERALRERLLGWLGTDFGGVLADRLAEDGGDELERQLADKEAIY